MAGLLSGLASLGLENLENAKVYEEPKAENAEDSAGAAGASPKIVEKELIYDKTYECPVCSNKVTAKIMKTGKAKLIGTDMDLRPQYEGIDVVKYDVILCPHCGYTAVARFFGPMPSVQVKAIRENISQNVKLTPHTGEIYTYDEAMERYKLALACAIVKQAKASEKAYVCLKSAWLLRGMQESLNEEEEGYETKIAEMKAEEDEFLKNAMEGFINARQNESFPICGMNEAALDYLVAVLAIRFEQYDTASKLVAAILVSPSANPRMKDKARDLKDIIVNDMKQKK